jgi:hypothetical protein
VILDPLCPAWLYKLTVTICWLFVSKAISSLTTICPLGTVKLDLPPTVMAARGDGWMLETPARPLRGRAMEADVMGRSEPERGVGNLDNRVDFYERCTNVCKAVVFLGGLPGVEHANVDLPPKVLDMAMRSVGAPIDMWRVWRRVASLRTPPED